MSDGFSRRLAAIVIGALMVAILVAPALAARRAQPNNSAAGTVSLAPALHADGTFVGAPAMSGTIDTARWTLVSDLAVGEPPRFLPGAVTAQSVTPGTWHALGSDVAGTDGAIKTQAGAPAVPGIYVNAVAVMGTDLFVGGNFADVAGIAEADHIAKWNGTTWSALGGNGPGVGSLTDHVEALAVMGTDLFVGGRFQDADGDVKADFVAKWSTLTSGWSHLDESVGGGGSLTNLVKALAVSGTDLFVGGVFINADGISTADRIAKWDTTANSGNGAWSALGDNGPGVGSLDSTVWALHASGASLYVGGQFTNADGIATADRIARWDITGQTWNAVGSNGSGDGAIGNFWVDALAVSGSTVYAGGNFTNANGLPNADFLAMFDGNSWSAVGDNGAGGPALGHNVYELSLVGTDLFVGGQFSNAGGQAEADFLAKWDGTDWHALSSNGAGGASLSGIVNAVGFLGPDLIAGGNFTNIPNAVPSAALADKIARFVETPPFTGKPDGRIRKGTGAFVGNNVYNADGTSQTKQGAKARGETIKFGISIQNDHATDSDSFTVEATGSASTMYTVTYFRGTTDITAQVVAGTYATGVLAPGQTWLITAKVKVNNIATAGSSVTRLVTITSDGDGSTVDAVKFVGKRA